MRRCIKPSIKPLGSASSTVHSTVSRLSGLHRFMFHRLSIFALRLYSRSEVALASAHSNNTSSTAQDDEIGYVHDCTGATTLKKSPCLSPTMYTCSSFYSSKAQNYQPEQS
jgi:hypothetical protein